MSGDLQPRITELRVLIGPSIEGDAVLQSWCSDRCLSRYLLARKLDVKKAHRMLQNTIQWRKDYKPDQISWKDVKDEAKTGKIVVYPAPDLDGRPIVLMRPRNENSKNADMQIKFLVYSLECIARMADLSGHDKMTWLIDFQGYSIKNAPPPKVGIQTLSILQNHYPERLGLAVCYTPPWVFSLTWKAVSPFIDPVTAQKIHFVDKKGSKSAMSKYFDMSKLEKSMSGSSDWQFDVNDYERQQLAYESSRAATIPAADGKNDAL